MCRHFWNEIRDFIAENLGVENVQDYINMKNDKFLFYIEHTLRNILYEGICTVFKC